MKENLQIVLVAPQIPLNTGSIGRLCVCTNSTLHLIKPLGFSLDASKIRRAGLDYWKHLSLKVHENWKDFLHQEKPSNLFFSTSRGKKYHYEYSFSKGEFLVFGSETLGLPEELYSQYKDDLYSIPMFGTHARTLNLANSVSIILYEAIRQISFSK